MLLVIAPYIKTNYKLKHIQHLTFCLNLKGNNNLKKQTYSPVNCKNADNLTLKILVLI